MNNIITNYTSPGHPTAFSGVQNVKRFHGSKFSQKRIIDSLQSIDAFTKHRKKPKPKNYNPILLYTKREQIQMDLIAVDGLQYHNNGVKFLLVAIDSFTKKAGVIPLKRKTKENVLNAIKLIFHEVLPPKPKTVCFDKGSEFMNALIKKYLRDENITHFNLTGPHKAAIAERFNRTLQGLIYRYLTHNNTKRYIDVLPLLLNTYNNRYHSSIKMTPNQAEKPQNAYLVRANLGINHSEVLLTTKPPKLKEGDIVRASLQRVGPRHNFRRGYKIQFSDDLYTIDAVKTNLPIIMYKIRDSNNRLLDKSFYESELQLIS